MSQPDKFTEGAGSGHDISEIFNPPTYAVWGDAEHACAVLGWSGIGVGVTGVCDAYNPAEPSQPTGVSGTSPWGTGVRGDSVYNTGVSGIAGNVGVYAENLNAGNAAYLASQCCAGDFYGPVWVHADAHVLGYLFKPGGGFRIDHPDDPGGKYLAHSFVESSEMKNFYDGVVTLNEKGEAEVELPDWFEHLNGDFRYQLTSIGAPAPSLHISAEVANGAFRIAGGIGGTKVSWTVTGIRKDPWAKANPISVETVKPDDEQGTYLHPDLYGRSVEDGIQHSRHPDRDTLYREVRERARPPR